MNHCCHTNKTPTNKIRHRTKFLKRIEKINSDHTCIISYCRHYYFIITPRLNNIATCAKFRNFGSLCWEVVTPSKHHQRGASAKFPLGPVQNACSLSWRQRGSTTTSGNWLWQQRSLGGSAGLAKYKPSQDGGEKRAT